VPAEIRYDAPDPFVHKVIINRGSHHDIQAGAPVVNEEGVLGQVTRVYPLHAEVTLLTDKDQAIPVQLTRTGMRGLIYGTSRGESLVLRFVSVNADIQPGDDIMTSGLDGIFPPGLPVAKVLKVDRQTSIEFAQVTCTPVALIRSTRQLLVLHYKDPPPIPAAPAFAPSQKPATLPKSKVIKRIPS
jgi:rod shape-determining protein MreC